MYEEIKFVDYGQKEQAGYYGVTYDKEKILKEPKLQVILVNHAHCDPGWLKTYEQYYDDQVDHILYEMKDYLSSNKEMKFVQVEISFFEMFFRKLDAQNREDIKLLIKNKQLEIVSGGWVMADEACAHYFAQIVEMFEGHEFTKNHLEFVPKNHWSIDPFGLSPTMAYLMKQAGFQNMAIQRVHYKVKQYFAQNKLFEFKWKQLFEGDSNRTSILTHMFPYGSYTTSETCGPAQDVCEEFDFRFKSPFYDEKYQRRNRFSPTINEAAKRIADQFRKKATLMRTNNIFVPLGGDFSFEKKSEWISVFENYKVIYDQINSMPELNMEVKFGTLDDYFTINKKSIETENTHIPSVSGDFFTYADRPFYKRFDRILQHYLRTAEIVYSILLSTNDVPQDFDYNVMVQARRTLSLFQHHDGITGTSKHFVIEDFKNKMVVAIKNCYQIIEMGIKQKLNILDGLSIMESMSVQNALPASNGIVNENNIIIFNPLTREQDEIICIKINIDGAKIKSIKDLGEFEQEIHPIVIHEQDALRIDENAYELCFKANIPPLDVRSFELVESSYIKYDVSKVSKKNVELRENKFFQNIEERPSIDFDIGNKNKITIDSLTGYILAINSQKVKLSFAAYQSSYASGAYLFMPSGKSSILPALKNSYIVSEGNLIQRVYVSGVDNVNLLHIIEVKEGTNYVEFENRVDLQKVDNFEMTMQFDTDVKNKDTFYTDLNGFQIIKRKRFSKLPIQGNYYPMPSTIFIQDSNTRITLVGSQALGCSSLSDGGFEVMLDRRLNQDDYRGLDEAVTDNTKTQSKFRLLIENFKTAQDDTHSVTSFLSLDAQKANQELHYPLILIKGSLQKDISTMTILKKELPADLHIVTMRSLLAKEDYDDKNSKEEVKRSSKNEIALIFHRFSTKNYLQIDTKYLLKETS
uniref:Alpha-mannosidase n=1 Tax=Rhabditophanes sp. KR3021 TaxID=114890 RepID=A0AC35UIG0_9BILA